MTKRPLNVLVFPAGMENGLEVIKALRSCKEVCVFGASSDVVNHAFFVCKDVAIIRDVREEGWIDDLNAAIEKHKIDLVFPANSIVIDHLSPARGKINARILLPEHDIIALTRSKKATLAALKDAIPLPVCFDSPASIAAYPVFAKPDGGYGSQGARLVQNEQEARSINFDTFVVQEYLSGKEYTVDCFSDSDGRLLFSGARERSRVRMATSMHAETVAPELEAKLKTYAEAILRKIKITGAWFFQVKEDASGEPRLLEIDVRIAGTMCFNRARGINFPLLSIFQFMGTKVAPLVLKEPLVLDRCLKNRYSFDYEYDSVYVDLDDTLIIHGKVNVELVQFLYQCINNGKKLFLLSKHLGPDIKAYLQSFRLSGLFDDIIWIEETKSKADYITEKKALFIDDSFSQRKDVHERCGIPVFDPSMIEALLDDRI